MSEISMNKLPAPTWNWLQLNDRRIALPAEARQAVFTTVMLPEEVTIPGGKKNLEWHGLLQAYSRTNRTSGYCHECRRRIK